MKLFTKQNYKHKQEMNSKRLLVAAAHITMGWRAYLLHNALSVPTLIQYYITMELITVPRAQSIKYISISLFPKTPIITPFLFQRMILILLPI